MKATKNKIRILLPVAGFLAGCLLAMIIALIVAYRDAAPMVPPLYETVCDMFSFNDVQLVICLLGSWDLGYRMYSKHCDCITAKTY